MSDDTNAQGTPPPSTPSGPSWTPPPPTPTPPAPEYQNYQAPPDATGGTPAPAKTGPSINASAPMVFGFVAVAAIVLATFIKETEISFWDQFGGLWSLFAIAAAVLTLLPALRTVVNVGPELAWKLAAGGAAALVLWWVLFVLPNIGQPQVANLTFLATVGVAAGVLAVWTSPDNSLKSHADSSSSS